MCLCLCCCIRLRLTRPRPESEPEPPGRDAFTADGGEQQGPLSAETVGGEANDGGGRDEEAVGHYYLGGGRGGADLMVGIVGLYDTCISSYRGVGALYDVGRCRGWDIEMRGRR